MGLYRGFCEGPGKAVICVNCEGTGCAVLSYTPYTGRRTRRGIKEIQKSRGTFIVTGVGGVGETMTYAEFLKKIPERKIS
jgi:type II secretory ATPase GspE/PulE/Tfp pilus assembly ATPase PilB-like protein